MKIQRFMGASIILMLLFFGVSGDVTAAESHPPMPEALEAME